MTDNEIIKDLECLINNWSEFSSYRACIMVYNALDLINRQKAEIEMLKQSQVIHVDISEQFKKECEYEIKAAKGEAIKEFAERLKRGCGKFKTKEISMLVFTESSFDYMTKEMVGELDV